MKTAALVVAVLSFAAGQARAADPAPAFAPAEPAKAIEAAPAAVAAAPAVEEKPAPVAQAAAVVAPAPAAAPVDQKPAAGWNNGFFLRAPDGDLELRVGGDIQVDGRSFVGYGANALTDQFLFRRARPTIKGTLGKYVDFIVQPDVAGNKVALADAYGDLKLAPFLKVRFGKFRTPLGLEKLQSSDDTVFTELALASNLSATRSVGFALFGDVAGVVSYTVALTDGVADGGSVETDVGSNKEISGRLLVTPFGATELSLLKGLGLGAAASYGEPHGTLNAAGDAVAATLLPTSYVDDGQNAVFKYAADSKSTPAKTVIADGYHSRWAAQGYYYAGPVGIQAEYIRSEQRVRLDKTVQRPRNWGWDAQASVVLTGEASTYKGVTPARNFDPAHGGFGAVEVAGRLAELRVDETLFRTGFADPKASASHVWAVGGAVNWYLSRNVRLSLDYVRTRFFDGAADASGKKAVDRTPENALLTRFQTVF